MNNIASHSTTFSAKGYNALAVLKGQIVDRNTMPGPRAYGFSLQQGPLRAVTANGVFQITSWKPEGIYCANDFISLGRILNIKIGKLSFNSLTKKRPIEYMKVLTKTNVATMHIMKNTTRWCAKLIAKVNQPCEAGINDEIKVNNKKWKNAIKFHKQNDKTQRTNITALAQQLFAKVFQNTRKYMEKFVEMIIKFIPIEKFSDFVLPDIYHDARSEVNEDLQLKMKLKEKKKTQELTDKQVIESIKRNPDLFGTEESPHVIYSKWKSGQIRTDVFRQQAVGINIKPDYDHWNTLPYLQKTKSDTIPEMEKRHEILRKTQEIKMETIRTTHELNQNLENMRRDTIEHRQKTALELARLSKEAAAAKLQAAAIAKETALIKRR